MRRRNVTLGPVRRTACAALLLAAAVSVAAEPDQDKSLRQLVARMTLAEKIGQLNLVPGGRSKNLNSKIDDAERQRIRDGRVGAYLHVAGAAFLGELQHIAVDESRLGIPLLFGTDIVHGYRTVFPVPIALASSWDNSVVTGASRVAATEAAASGLHWTFAPMIDIARDPRWGRIVEGAGADPYLGARMAVAQVSGFQGTSLSAADTILATAKHFGAYGAALGGRDYDSADVSQRTMNEVYLPPFYAASNAGVASIMSAFNDIAGVPSTSNAGLLRTTLRDTWHYGGFVVSDWNAIAELINHGVAADRTQAAGLALAAGVDMDMSSLVYSDSLQAVVRSDDSLLALIDAAVLRVLRAKQSLGLFDTPQQYHDAAREHALLLSDAHRAAARNAAERSIVLLRNDGNLLPLPANLQRIAVVGALADDRLSPLGSWRARGREEDVVTVLEGIRQYAAGRIEVEFEPGAMPRSSDSSGIAAAVAAARRADAVILVVGEDFDYSGEARSRADLSLPGAQLALAKAVIATGTPVVVVLMNGRPLAIPWLADNADAILETWLLGVETGPAVAATVFGDVTPGGKLPVPWPRSSGGLPHAYDHYPTGRPADADLDKDTARYMDLPITPQFAFGHGLSYTRFAYDELHFDTPVIRPDQAITLQATVTNTGTRRGDEVVQLYVRDPLAAVARPVRQLRGYARVTLDVGQSATIEFVLQAAQLAYYDADGRWRIDAGRIDVMIGASSDDIQLHGHFDILGSGYGQAPAAALPTSVNVRYAPALR